MASEYRIHKPYVLATLPRPLDHTGGGIVAREIYGQRDGVRKKRTELAVGVDGEAVSIYDVPGSKLVTSYPIPPQESFTCPPHSLRIRRSDTTDVSRYTFIGTKDATSHKVTLFKDVVRHDGKTTSTTEHRALRNSPVRYIITGGPSQTSVTGDIIVVCQNGEIFCLSGESLAIRWTSPAKSVVQDASSAAVDNFEVDFVTSGTMSELSEGVFKNRPEVYTALPKVAGNEDSTLLIMVSRSTSQGRDSRHLLVLGVAASESPAASDIQKITPLDVAPLASSEEKLEAGIQYHFEGQTGMLLQLQSGALSVFDLTSAVPKLRSVIEMDDAVTFARLSRPFVLSCSQSSIGLYNYQYRSLHAKTRLDLSDLSDLQNPQQAQSCRLISYLRSQDLVVALVDNVLACIHVEPPRSNGKTRKAGMLIDSIGRGTAVEIPAKKLKLDHSRHEFSERIPGTMTAEYLAKYHKGIESADELLGYEDIANWEEMLRQKFHMKKTKSNIPEEPVGWEWLLEPSAYPAVDRRWVIYAISRLFTIEETAEEIPPYKLRLMFSDCPVTAYLAVAGHLTLSNLKSAFRDELEANTVDTKHLTRDLIRSLTEEDPSMTLLLNYLRATKLGEVEVLLAIRALMLNMDLISDTAKTDTSKLLTTEPHQPSTSSSPKEDDSNDKDEMDLDDLEREIAVTEHYLGDESSSRTRGLTLAFTKLWRLPSRTTIKALKTALRPDEILSLIHLLRIELVQGAWTSLYLDATALEAEGSEPPPDGVIALIADLLGRCLDAVGAGGWLFNDVTSDVETNDFISALKLEVTAALEGIQEAVSMNAAVGESVRYGIAAQKGGATRPLWNPNKPLPVALEGRESRMLPLGLKVKTLPSKTKVVSGGEVVDRSTREAGHLISQKVEAYSLEKIFI